MPGQPKPYLPCEIIIALIDNAGVQGLKAIHILIIAEEINNAYSKAELNAIWSALIDRYDKLERWLGMFNNN